jgi:probable F420-dependent oxidoreductase
MRFGAVFPTTEIGSDPIAVRDYVQAAEALGFVRLTTYDHVLGVDHADREPALHGPYKQHDPFHEPFVLFGFLAAHTTRIELATGVLVLPQRQTALVAKQAAEVDLLSGGRLVLGVGTGWNHVEYTSLGTPFRDRARRLDDQVAVLRALWDRELVDHDSEFHRIERAGILPRPGRQIPVWMGGSAEAALARSARVGDGHIFAGSTDRHFAAAAHLEGLLAEHDRERTAFGMDMFVDYAAGPDVWHDRAQRWEDFGETLMSMRSMTAGTSFLGVPAANLSGPDEHIAALERFAKEMADQP